VFHSWMRLNFCLRVGLLVFKILTYLISTRLLEGSPSHLLCVTDQQLMTIYQSCGFFNVKRNCFPDLIVQAFLEGLNVQIYITRYKKPASKISSLLVRIGQRSYPAKPLQQVRHKLQPPNHRLKKKKGSWWLVS
jgi:hypothetical protein